MRTRFEIAIADEGDEATLRAAGEEAFDEIERVEAQLSIFRPDSGLSKVNSAAGGEPLRVDPRLFNFLKRALQFSMMTDGAFDMTVGPLVHLWSNATASIPSEERIAAAKSLVGMRENLEIDETCGTVRLARPGTRLDPGAIGKGYALERASELMRETGIKNALLHGGTSTVVAIGTPPGEPFWRVALQHPLVKTQLLAGIELRDGFSLSVSAPHGKVVELAGRRFGHVIDPRSGWPVDNAALAAIVCPSATASDALSTALLVLGAEGIKLLASETVSLFAAQQQVGTQSLTNHIHGTVFKVG